MVTGSRKATARGFAALGEPAKRKKAQASLAVYAKKETRPRHRQTPKNSRPVASAEKE
jgi:hypothetical protein